MKLIKTAAAVLNQTPFDWENNTANILGAIETAREQGATILCLPELCITGYGCEDDFFRTDLRMRAWSILQEQILPASRGMIVSVGLPIMHQNALFNCAALLCDGKLLGLVAKRFLAGDGIHYEPRWFEAWPEGVVSIATVNGDSVPIGDIYFDVGGVKIGFEICEDAWVGRRPGALLASRGVDIFMNPSASHFAFGKIETRKRLVLEGSRAFNSTYIYSNLLGDEAGRAIYDGGAIIASAGNMLAIGPRFSFNLYEVTTAVIDVDLTRMAQARTFSYRPELTVAANECVTAPFDYPNIEPAPPACVALSDWEASETIKEEEFARSVALGLFDYMRKTRSHGYTISLSGGADSSCVTVLVQLMVALGTQQIGFEEFAARLSYIPGLKNLKSVQQMVRTLLACAYQASDNSSQQSLNSARTLAKALGATFYELNVSAVVQDYTDLVSEAVGRKLSWETDDIALQNIQARVRSPGIWLLANLRNAVLLCTSNRSEGAVGYCTMDGDTSGGLAPIAGVSKNFVRHWLRWMQNTGPIGLQPYPSLSVVNEQTPGPELRPLSAHQAGEADLMPYDVLDAIEDAAIQNNQSVADCYMLMRTHFPQYSPKTIAGWLQKFFHLWARNQWKRERLAPALHVASRNLDPRTWRRSPILSGAFAEELKDMWRLANEDELEREHGHATAAGAPLSNGTGLAGKAQRAALLVIDAQNGFGSKGELPVPDAESIVPVINELAQNFDVVVASQDWHPPTHISFASRHKGKKPGDVIEIHGGKQPLFPDHCIQETHGAQFLPNLNTKAFGRVFRKGTKADVDSFSVFRDNSGNPATEIDEYLRSHGVNEIYIVGLATNYCVFRSAMDAVELGFKVTVVVDGCRGIDEPKGAVQQSLKSMEDAGIKILKSSQVVKTGATSRN